MRRALPALLALLACLGFAAGCTLDKETTGPEISDSAPVPVTEDSLMSLFTASLTVMDIEQFTALVAPGFRFVLDPDFVATAEISADTLRRAEAVNVATNIFAGTPVIWGERIAPGVAGVAVDELEKADADWADGSFGDAFPAVRHCLYDIGLTISYSSVAHDTVVTGQARFSVVGRDTSLEGVKTTVFSLAGIEDFTAANAPAGPPSWSEVLLAYLINQAPDPIITTPVVVGGIDTVFTLSAATSDDEDSGLAPKPYRWRFSASGPWSDWTATPDTSVSYTAPGEMVVALEVRDRWGHADVAFRTLTVYPEHASSEDALIDAFEDAYASRSLFTYGLTLDESFSFLLQPETAADWGRDSTIVTREQDLAATENTFDTAHFIDLDLQATGQWTLTDPDHMYFPETWRRSYDFELAVFDDFAGLTYQASGEQIFYAAERDTVIDGAAVTYWLLVGQEDHSLLPGPEELEVTWGDIKLIYE